MIDRRTVARTIINRPVALPEKWVATVESLSPLRIRIRGNVPDSTPDSLVSNLHVGNSVWGETVAGRAVILGRFGGEEDMGNDTTSFTAATDWTVNDAVTRRVGRTVQFYCRFTRSGTAVTVPASGDIANTPVLTITDTLRRPVLGVALATYDTGPMCAGSVSTAGVLTLNAVAPGVTIPTGQQLSLAGTWLALNP